MLKVQLTSPQGQAGTFGAKTFVHVTGIDGVKVLVGMRESRSNCGYLAQDDPILHFGLDQHQTVDVMVRFLDGTQVTKQNVTSGREIIIDGREEAQ
ncbi:MAG: ASPIC/UnbV domain-containing protein [Planctomycetaceae bacterium]|nr:ASPIC/UnbV domain-containing protein [Planctomycetaceae bacterium]